jgi:hypothetical protein
MNPDLEPNRGWSSSFVRSCFRMVHCGVLGIVNVVNVRIQRRRNRSRLSVGNREPDTLVMLLRDNAPKCKLVAR